MSNRRLGGLRAKSEGDRFEEAFVRSCKWAGMKCTQMPMGCKRFGPGPAGLKQVKTAFDFIVSYNGNVALVDTKSSSSAALPNSKIEEHQMEELVGHQQQGVHAGYVVWLRKIDQVIFVPAHRLLECSKQRGSIRPLLGTTTSLGTIFTLDPRKIFDHVEPITQLYPDR